jgi:hypothetical protein
MLSKSALVLAVVNIIIGMLFGACGCSRQPVKSPPVTKVVKITTPEEQKKIEDAYLFILRGRVMRMIVNERFRLAEENLPPSDDLIFLEKDFDLLTGVLDLPANAKEALMWAKVHQTEENMREAYLIHIDAALAVEIGKAQLEMEEYNRIRFSLW